ncbi:hypothetical protein PAPYR_7020 [Paratrimastix pyriformis]|uniref:F-box domain-containing protein n=1 Tax=Paratrimastix pyriformis TaxID=342808 RepID=A0ABQ8UE23_9EUKA|nr:hypothetical protein PAPYR_7020 [Paratrimastix pyriformis]
MGQACCGPSGDEVSSTTCGPDLLTILPDELFSQLISHSEAPLQTYISFISLNRHLRALLPPSRHALSFAQLGSAESGRAPVPTGDAIAALMGPCSALEEVEFSPEWAVRQGGNGTGWVDRAFSRHPALHTLDVPSVGGLSTAAFVRIIELVGSQLRTLTLGRPMPSGPKWGSVPGALAAALAGRCPILRILRLYLDDDTSEDLGFLATLPSLVELEIQAGGRALPLRGDSGLLASLPHLERFNGEFVRPRPPEGLVDLTLWRRGGGPADGLFGDLLDGRLGGLRRLSLGLRPFEMPGVAAMISTLAHIEKVRWGDWVLVCHCKFNRHKDSPQAIARFTILPRASPATHTQPQLTSPYAIPSLHLEALDEPPSPVEEPPVACQLRSATLRDLTLGGPPTWSGCLTIDCPALVRCAFPPSPVSSVITNCPQLQVAERLEGWCALQIAQGRSLCAELAQWPALRVVSGLTLPASQLSGLIGRGARLESLDEVRGLVVTGDGMTSAEVRALPSLRLLEIDCRAGLRALVLAAPELRSLRVRFAAPGARVSLDCPGLDSLGLIDGGSPLRPMGVVWRGAVPRLVALELAGYPAGEARLLLADGLGLCPTCARPPAARDGGRRPAVTIASQTLVGLSVTDADLASLELRCPRLEGLALEAGTVGRVLIVGRPPGQDGDRAGGIGSGAALRVAGRDSRGAARGGGECLTRTDCRGSTDDLGTQKCLAVDPTRERDPEPDQT